MSDLQLDDTLFLVQRPSFLNGVARSTDLFGNFTEYNYSKTPEEADLKAIHRDWLIIMKDLCIACKKSILDVKKKK